MSECDIISEQRKGTYDERVDEPKVKRGPVEPVDLVEQSPRRIAELGQRRVERVRDWMHESQGSGSDEVVCVAETIRREGSHTVAVSFMQKDHRARFIEYSDSSAQDRVGSERERRKGRTVEGSPARARCLDRWLAHGWMRTRLGSERAHQAKYLYVVEIQHKVRY